MRDGTDLVHMLTDPKEAARQSQQLTNFSISLKVVNRMRTPELVIERTRQMLEEAAERDGSSSFAAHCRQIGVTKGFAQYRFPELCNKVVRLWLARLMRERSQRIRSAARLLVDSEWQLYVDGTHTSQDKLAAEISGKSGCTIRAARLIVEARIRGSRRKERRKTECVLLPTRHDECLMTNAEYAATFGKNLASANTLISLLRRKGDMFAIPVRGKRLPRFQFDIRGKPLPVMRRLLDHIRPGVEVDFFEWFLTPHKLLAGKRPEDVLDQGADGMLLSLVEAEFGDEHTRSGQSAS